MDDLIKRGDAIDALVATEEIKGHAYTEMYARLKAIPAQEGSTYDKSNSDDGRIE